MKNNIKNQNKIQHSHINSDNYDFVWRTWFNYLAVHFFYGVEYRERDFVFVWKDGEYLCFVSKEERKRLAQEGLRLYTDEFEAFEARMEKAIPNYAVALGEHADADISAYSDSVLNKKYKELLDTLSVAFKDYFFLEYHSTDEVARIINERDENYDLKLFGETCEKMGRIKLRLREVTFNSVWYAPFLVDKYAREIANRLQLEEDYYRYQYSELIAMLDGQKIDAKARHGTVVWGKFSNHKEITGEDAKCILKKLHNIDMSVTQFKGQIGNKGVYRGPVKIINFSSDTNFSAEIEAMQKGDVLVAGSTGPEMILACKKAGAIVTDEGGVISHAAIVSREFGIPSVIGTKVATSVLKAGDIVEVDANRGVVRIIIKRLNNSRAQ